MLESAIQRKIILALKEAGCHVVVVKVGAVGTPDLIVCAPGGRFVALECKTSVGRPTKAQLHQIELIQRAGGVAMVVRSVQDALMAIGVYNEHHERGKSPTSIHEIDDSDTATD